MAITNLALRFGAELGSELERGCELQAGLPAEKELPLPPRATKLLEKEAENVEQGRTLRQTRGARK